MTVRPLHDRLVVRRLDEGEQSIGGILIPDSAREKRQRGTVVAAGTGTLREDGTRVPLDVSIVVQRTRGMSEEEGFNAQTERYENLVQAGVFDPTKVIRSALQNAASIASLLLTTEAVLSLMPLHVGHNGSGPMNGAGDAGIY